MVKIYRFTNFLLIKTCRYKKDSSDGFIGSFVGHKCVAFFFFSFLENNLFSNYGSLDISLDHMLDGRTDDRTADKWLNRPQIGDHIISTILSYMYPKLLTYCLHILHLHNLLQFSEIYFLNVLILGLL